jgi:hypothetical protein
MSGGSFCGGNAGKIEGNTFSSRKLLISSFGQKDDGVAGICVCGILVSAGTSEGVFGVCGVFEVSLPVAKSVKNDIEGKL